MSPILDASHDLAHPVEGDSAWSESYYFNCYDPDSDCGFFTRIGVRPNEGTMDVGLSVWVPGGGVAHIRHVVPTDRMVDTVLEVGPVRYRMIEAAKRWHLSADGESSLGLLGMDVTFDALMPPVGADGQRSEGTGASSDASKTVGKGHLEQAGRWSGTISIGNEKVSLGRAARGNRDKSWGPRRWGAPRMWRWFSVNIDDQTHFGGILIRTGSADLHRGWAWVDKELQSVREWEVRSELEDDGLTHKLSLVTAVDKAGTRHELRGEMLRVEPGARGVRPGATIVNEGLARWTYRGVVGYGISEYLHQLDDNARPVVSIE